MTISKEHITINERKIIGEELILLLMITRPALSAIQISRILSYNSRRIKDENSYENLRKKARQISQVREIYGKA